MMSFFSIDVPSSDQWLSKASSRSLWSQMIGIYSEEVPETQEPTVPDEADVPEKEVDIGPIIAVMALTATILAFQAFVSYVNFVKDFDDGDYFESGAFLGGSLVDVVNVVYIIILIVEIS